MSRSLLLPALLLAMSSVTALGAQELRLAAVQAWTSDPLWADPRGWSLGFQYPASDRLGLRVGVSAASSRQERTGIPCAGLIPPTGCAPESLEDHGRLLDLRLGVAGTVMRRERIALDVAADVHWIEGTSDTRAPQSGRALSASQGYWGPGIGVDLRFTPRPGGALGLFLAAQAVWWKPRDVEACCDRYMPFTETVRAPTLSAGVSWAVRLRAEP
ncbi:MAG: hypothetical protein ACT4P7_10970 [Gemmatimonadaceae bacterium]